MSDQLHGQKAVVVGGSSGIGLASAEALLAAGADVVVASRSESRLAAVRGGLGPRATTHVVDGAEETSVRALFADAGVFDHLIIALGGGGAVGPFAELEEARFRAAFDRKFWPFMLVARHGAARIRAGGSITFITGAAARRVIPRMSGIAAVNGAIEAMIRPLARELAPTRVNAVSPGLIDTPYWHGMPAEQREAMFAQTARGLAVGRVGRPQEVADAVLFLVTNGFTTGTVIECDGGVGLV